MTKREFLELLKDIPLGEEISCVFSDPTQDDPAEDGDVLEVLKIALEPRIGYTIYVKKP